MHVMNHLGIGDEISALSVRPEVCFQVARLWRVIDRFELSEEHLKLHKAPYNQVHAPITCHVGESRLKLNKNLVHLNKKQSAIPRQVVVELHFEDGSSSRSDLLIGADGVKSVIVTSRRDSKNYLHR